jgi:hypothetical protein
VLACYRTLAVGNHSSKGAELKIDFNYYYGDKITENEINWISGANANVLVREKV